MSAITEFANTVLLHHSQHNEIAFAHLFELQDDSPGVIALREELAQIKEKQYAPKVANILEDTSIALSDFVLAYLRLLHHSFDDDLSVVYSYYEAFYSSLLSVFSGAESYYQVTLVKNLSSTLVDLAFLVDEQYDFRGKSRRVNSAARLLSKMFNIMIADRSPSETSKRQGIFHVTNLAFKIYTQLDSLRLCQTYIANIHTGNVELSNYPISQQVTYRYYLGRYYLYQNLLELAESHLTFAFENTTVHHWNNKRMILEYLIPTRFILGRMPKPELLVKYKLTVPYTDMIEKIKQGNIKGYLDVLDEHFEYFSRCFLYILLRERGVVLAWRSLIRRAYLTKRSGDDRHHVLMFSDCLKAFQFATHDNTLDVHDIECILVSLISQGYIRGYLHHSKQRLVLSKVNAFPPVSQVRVHTEVYNEDSVNDHMEHTPRTIESHN